MGSLTTAMLSVSRTRKAMVGITGSFFIQAFLAVSWLPRIPEIIDNLNVGFAAWGIIVGIAGTGSLAPLLFTNTLINRFGTRPLLQSSLVLSLICVGSLGFISNPWLFFLALFLQNFGFGIYNLAINSHSVVFQNRIGRVVLGRFHAAWSIGAASSAMLTGLFAGVLSLEHYLFWVAVVATVILFLASSQMLGPREDGHEQERKRAAAVPLLKTPKHVIILAFGLFFTVMPEVTMMDWGAVFGKKVMHLSPALQGMPYTLFVVAMIAGRLSVGKLAKRNHFSKVGLQTALLGATSLTLAVGIGTWLGGVDPLLALAVTALLWIATGLGAGPQVPALFSVTGSVNGMTTAQVMSRMSLLNSTFIMVTKLFMGAIAQGAGVPFVFLIGLGAFIGAAFVSRYLLAKHKATQANIDAFPITSPMAVINEESLEA